MERDLSFHLLHDLMNMAVQYGHGTKALDVRQGLLAVVGSPAPVGINGPQGDVSEEHNRSAGRAALQIVLKPLELLVTERPHASGFQIGDIHESHKVDALLIEAVPAAALCAFPIALQKLLAVVAQHVVLTGHKVNLFRGRSL